MKQEKQLGFQVKLEVLVEKDEKILSRYKQMSKSLLRAFMYWMHSKFTMPSNDENPFFAEEWTTADTSNTSRTFPQGVTSHEKKFGCFGAVVTQDQSGIRVGTSSEDVTAVDHELVSRIAHGNAEGQLVYNAQTLEAVSLIEKTSSFRVTRTFTNNSGATITVKEIGAAFNQADDGQEYRYVLYLRDVLVSPSSVPDGASLTVRYTFSVTA